MEYILGLPLATKPDIFGLHENSDLIKERQESELLLNSILKTQVSKLIIKLNMIILNIAFF